jgi:putative ABC transport system substrate-binding protein
LRGAKPTSLPVEQASIFRMMVNLKAARAMGIKIPESIRLRADEIIE